MEKTKTVKVAIPAEMYEYIQKLCVKYSWLGTVDDVILEGVRNHMLDFVYLA
jgi:hypothetical protein